MRLANQVAIVTGAGRGLGEQVARAFCREGAKVVLASEVASEVESVAADLKAQGFPALGICADVRDEQSIRALFQRTREAFEEVDILVNCAGAAQGGDVLTLSTDLIDEALSLKSYSYLRLSQRNLLS